MSCGSAIKNENKTAFLNVPIKQSAPIFKIISMIPDPLALTFLLGFTHLKYKINYDSLVAKRVL
jgi:hypothetical protein